MKEFFEEYWQRYDKLHNYFLVNYGIRMAYDHIPFVREEIDKLPINSSFWPRIQYNMNKSYEKFPYDKILQNVFLHKLSYKKDWDMTTPGTVFREIQKRYAPETIQK